MASPSPSQNERRDFLRQLAFGWPAAAGLALLASSRIRAAEIGPAYVANLRLPLFAPDGRLIRRLTAESAQGLTTMTLQGGKVDFFATKSGTAPVAWMNFDDARYEPAQQIATGENLLRFESLDGGKLAGRGYRYENRANRLTLQSHVWGEFQGNYLAAPECELRFDPAQVEEIDVVREMLFPRGLIFTGVSLRKIDVTRVRATAAHYRAETGLLHLQGPLYYLADGLEGEQPADGDVMELRLRPAATTVAKP